VNIQKNVHKKRHSSIGDAKTSNDLNNDLYNDFGSRRPESSFKVARYKQVRQDSRSNSFSYPMIGIDRKSINYTGRSTKPTAIADYGSDYLMDEGPGFKVTFDKNSTSITEMGNSDFSFTEAHDTHNPLMNQSMSNAGKRKRGTA
jgi:hypothetical protein